MSLALGRYRVRLPEILAVQVSPENAREVAVWCDGWATDDLPWSEHMQCYCRPQDGSAMAGAMFPGDRRLQVPGAVMMGFGVMVTPGDWVIHTGTRFTFCRDSEFQSRYTLVPDPPESWCPRCEGIGVVLPVGAWKAEQCPFCAGNLHPSNWPRGVS